MSNARENVDKLFVPFAPVGADPTGSVASTTAIQAAIDAAAAAGGGAVLLPAGEFLCGPLTITSSGVKLVGAGSGFFSTTDITPATKIVYGGAAGGTMMTVSSVSGASNNKVCNAGVIGIGFDGDSTAAKGVVINSVNNSEFDFSVQGCTSVQCEVGTVAALEDARDPQHNTFKYIRVNATGSQNGITLDTATIGANVSMNRFGYLYARHENGHGVKIGNCDNNVFDLITCALIGGGTGKGVVLGAGDGVNTLNARGNNLLIVSPGAGGVYAEGTETAAVASGPNVIWYFDAENWPLPANAPTLESGVTLTWGTTKGVMGMSGLWYTGFSSSHANAVAATALAVSTEVPAYFVAANGKAIAISNGAGDAIYGINVNATSGALRFTRSGAAVNFIEMDTAFFGDHADDVAAAAAGVDVGELYRTGSALKIRVA